MSALIAVQGLSDGIGFDDLVYWATGVAAIITALLIVGRPLRAYGKWLAKFREDWEGQPARPGHDAVPGIMERMQRIDGEMTHNHGSSLKDAVTDTRKDLQEIKTCVKSLSKEIEQYSTIHGQIFEALVILDERTNNPPTWQDKDGKAD